MWWAWFGRWWAGGRKLDRASPLLACWKGRKQVWDAVVVAVAAVVVVAAVAVAAAVAAAAVCHGRAASRGRGAAGGPWWAWAWASCQTPRTRGSRCHCRSGTPSSSLAGSAIVLGMSVRQPSNKSRATKGVGAEGTYQLLLPAMVAPSSPALSAPPHSPLHTMVPDHPCSAHYEVCQFIADM